MIEVVKVAVDPFEPISIKIKSREDFEIFKHLLNCWMTPNWCRDAKAVQLAVQTIVNQLKYLGYSV